MERSGDADMSDGTQEAKQLRELEMEPPREGCEPEGMLPAKGVPREASPEPPKEGCEAEGVPPAEEVSPGGVGSLELPVGASRSEEKRSGDVLPKGVEPRAKHRSQEKGENHTDGRCNQ